MRFFLFLVFGFVALAQEKTSVLFLGNSLTFYNDMPKMVQKLAESTDLDCDIVMHALPGVSLEQHVNNPKTIEMIRSKNWRYVVLQDRSNNPILRENFKSMFEAMAQLQKLCIENGSTPVLFKTWGFRNGYHEKGFPDFDSMKAQLDRTFKVLEDNLKIRVIPVGDAWAHCHEKDPKFWLWDQDSYHPSAKGSYLSACVFLIDLLEVDITGKNLNRCGLSKKHALFLQRMAKESLETK